MKLALIGFGNVARALLPLLHRQRALLPVTVVGIHTRRQGSIVAPDGLDLIQPQPAFGPRLPSVEAFLDAARPDVAVELTTLDPSSGEPATSHIRAAFNRRIHVVTANKGPIAHHYAALRECAARQGVLFRFESTCMDGAPVFNMVRDHLPGVTVLGFTGVLNSTTKVVIAAMRRGLSMEEGVAEARRLGVTEADASFDIDGWDSAAKTAALANVLLDARTNPLAVDRKGIGRLTPEKLAELHAKGKTVCLVSRARRQPGGAVKMRVRAEVLDETDMLATVEGTSNLLLLETDLMGTVGTVSIRPGIEQTAFGVFTDLVEIERNL